MRYWRSFMTVGRPTAHWAPKKKKENIRKKKNCANYSSQYLWLSHNLISCKDVYNYIYRSHQSLGGDCICYDISITLQESGGGAGWCRGELSARSNRVWCFTAAPDNSLCFQMFSSRSSSLKLLACLSPTTFNSAKSRSFNGVAQIYWSWSMLGIFSIR